jgi:hypothetical protein
MQQDQKFSSILICLSLIQIEELYDEKNKFALQVRAGRQGSRAALPCDGLCYEWQTMATINYIKMRKSLHLFSLLVS